MSICLIRYIAVRVEEQRLYKFSRIQDESVASLVANDPVSGADCPPPLCEVHLIISTAARYSIPGREGLEAGTSHSEPSALTCTATHVSTSSSHFSKLSYVVRAIFRVLGPS